MLIETAKLLGPDLDFWAAAAWGTYDRGWLLRHKDTSSIPKLSTDWGAAGEMLHDLHIDFEYGHDTAQAGGDAYCAMVHDFYAPIEGHRDSYTLLAKGFGPDHLVAAARAVVKSVYGETVPVNPTYEHLHLGAKA